MRPNTIRWFEYAIIASQLLRVATIASHLSVNAQVTGLAQQTILTGAFINVAVIIGLGLVISRARIGFARWFLLLVMVPDVAGLAGMPAAAELIGLPFAALSTMAVLLLVVAGVLMFRPASNAWLKRENIGEDRPESFNENASKPTKDDSWVHTIIVQWSKKRRKGD